MSNLSRFKHGIGPYVESALAGGLPPIRGRWFVVDPYAGTLGTPARELGEASTFTNLDDAYTACTSGAGDGILLLGAGTGTASHSTSYLKQSLAWSKHGITMVGVAAGNGYFGRARIANVEVTTGALTVLAFVQGADPVKDKITRTTGSFITDGFVAGQKLRVVTTGTGANGTGFVIGTVEALTLTLTSSDTLVTETAVNAGSSTVSSYNTENIVVSGSNNRFYNVHVANGSSDALAVGGVTVTANRNEFYNCHLLGANHATPAAETTAFDLTLSASECVFDRCYFGTNGIIRAATNGNLVLGISTTQIGQNFFRDCYFISYSATTTRGAILITNAATLGGFITFENCKFLNWNSGAQTAIATIIIGATPNNLGLLLDRCASVGYSAVGANNDTWFTTGAASAAGTGTIAASIT
jgi:hypothetical protein